MKFHPFAIDRSQVARGQGQAEASKRAAAHSSHRIITIITMSGWLASLGDAVGVDAAMALEQLKQQAEKLKEVRVCVCVCVCV